MRRFVHAFSLACLVPLTLALQAAGCGDDDATPPGPSSSSSSGTTTTTGMGGAGGDGGGGGAPGCDITPAETYDGAAYDANAATELAVRTQFFALNSLMRSAEVDLMVVPTVDELNALYEAGTPSVKDVTSAYYDGRVQSVFVEFAAAAGNTWVPDPVPSGPGGKYGNYIFSAFGTDLRQAVEKGLFHAAFYNHALTRVAAATEEAAVDQVLAAFGAHPSFPGDSETSDPGINPYPDRIGAQYAERRSPKDPSDSSRPLDPANPGPYFRIKADLILAKAAIQAGPLCDTVRDEALARVMQDWERAIFATVVYYLNDASLKLTLPNPTEADLASGLHGYGEAVAFVHGFRGLPEDGRIITDAQIDALLELLGAPAQGQATSYMLLTDPAATVPNLVLAINEVATLYGFSPAEVEGFKVNH